MDRKPEDGYLSEWEVWSVVSDVLAASSRQWIESRFTDSTMVQFERKTGVSRAESDDEELSLQNNTAPTIASEMSVFQRLARTAGRSDPGSAASDDTSDMEELTMPAGAVGDGVVRLAARLDPVFPVMYKWYADQVMLFSGNLHASMYAEFRVGLSRELQLAMLMFDGLAEHGMVYRTDPSSPYADYSQDPAVLILT